MNNKDNKSQWIKRETPPEYNALCYVTNIRAGIDCYTAIYCKFRDYFYLYNPNLREHPPIDVTHYIILPSYPDDETLEEEPPIMQVHFKKTLAKKSKKSKK